MTIAHRYFFLVVSLLLFLPIVSSLNVDIETPLNQSSLNVNNSQYLQGYTPLTLRTWMENHFDLVYAPLSSLADYLPLAGGTMTGDINMNGKSLLNADNIYTIDETYNQTYINDTFIRGDLVSEDVITNVTDYGYALDFDGVNDYVELGDSDDFKTENFTISVWVKSTSVGDWEGLLTTIDYTAYAREGYAIAITGDNVAAFATTNGYGFNDVVSGTTNVRDGNWHLVSIIYNESEMSLYVDGIKEGTPAVVTLVHSSSSFPLQLGRYRSTKTANSMKGLMDEVSFFNRSLNQAEITTLYNSGSGLYADTSIAPFNDGLVAGYHFDEGTGTNAEDITGDNDGTISGATWVDGKVGRIIQIITEGGFGQIPFLIGDNKVSVNGSYQFLNNTILPYDNESSIGNETLKWYQGWFTNLFTNYFETETLNVTGYISGKRYVTQYHRNASIDTTSANTWVNITWDLTIDNETTSGYSLDDSNVSIVIANNGIYRIQGCLHPKNNGVGNQEASLYSRILINGIEAKCLQFANSKEFKTTGIDTMPFTGTIYAKAGQKVQLQYYVTSVNIDFEGDAIFEDGVAGSINFERISN